MTPQHTDIKSYSKSPRKLPRKSSARLIGTKVLDDVFTDETALLKPRIEQDYDTFLKILWDSNPDIFNLLVTSDTIESARDSFYDYLNKKEREIFDVDNNLHILEKAVVRDSIRALKSIIGPVNEFRTEFSALEALVQLAKKRQDKLKGKISVGFILEFTNIFKAVRGKSNIYLKDTEIKKGIPEFLKLKGREAAIERMRILDNLGDRIIGHMSRYNSGLEKEIIETRKKNRSRILAYLKGSIENWDDYRWQLHKVIKSPDPLNELIELNDEHKRAVAKAVRSKVAFGITPYYLSLMDKELSDTKDHAVRAQVIPPEDYINEMALHSIDREISFDFMGEHDTSPIDLVTRRYPLISILKPFNTCAQICVYCQRNWEIERVLDPHALASKSKIDEALNWFDDHDVIGDVLITGGDPLVMSDSRIDRLLGALASKPKVFRIRLGTRTPVVLPMRFTDNFVRILNKYHNPPKLEIAVVTHFEHSYEVTPEAATAVQKLRKSGISVYNQQVFTIENSRRFETARLRRDLKSIGVDPYYTFNMKGKEETRSYMVPIARILQERKEEARLLPGLDRTDEPVFNVPKLGKNHLRAWQDHRLVMILPDGARVYEFHPWEKNISAVPPYNYVDVPIYDYLKELAARGENVNDYRTIWYYY